MTNQSTSQKPALSSQGFREAAALSPPVGAAAPSNRDLVLEGCMRFVERVNAGNGPKGTDIRHARAVEATTTELMNETFRHCRVRFKASGKKK